MGQAWQKYMEGSAVSTNTTLNTINLYGRMILDLKNAKEHMESFQFVKADEFLLHAELILRNLILQIDPGVSEEIAHQFYEMYASWYKLLKYEMMYKEGKELERLIPMIEEMRDAFQEAYRKEKK